MSSRRSRSGGSCDRHARAGGRRGPRGSGRRRPRASRSRLVAATTRTSTLIGASPPTRSNSRSCSTRSSLTCIAGGMSPTSSRKSVPPSASSKRPSLLLDRAGERALLVAEQLALEQRLGERGAVDLDERAVRALASGWWIARATSSLPVPRLAGDEHRGVGRRRPSRRVRRTWRILLAAADELGEAAVGVLARSVLVSASALRAARRAARSSSARSTLRRTTSGCERLDEEVERAELHRLDRGLDRAEGGDDHDRARRGRARATRAAPRRRRARPS